MNTSTSCQFISSLAKYLQNLCNGYVDYNKFVLVRGHLYVTVDADQSISFVVNEQLCKIDGNGPSVLSNSSISPIESHDNGRTNSFQNTNVGAEHETPVTFGMEVNHSMGSENQPQLDIERRHNASLPDNIWQNRVNHQFPNPVKADDSSEETNSDSDTVSQETEMSSIDREVSTMNPSIIKEEVTFSDTEETPMLTFEQDSNEDVTQPCTDIKTEISHYDDDNIFSPVRSNSLNPTVSTQNNTSLQLSNISTQGLQMDTDLMLLSKLRNSAFQKDFILPQNQQQQKKKNKSHKKQKPKKELEQQDSVKPEAANCEICGKMFPTLQRLQLHLASHSTDRPFQCDVCQATFKLKSTLRQHRATHSLEKRFQCHVCSMRFSSRNGLKMHASTHSDTRDHACQQCAQSFTHPYLLKQHVRRTHWVVTQYFRCETCDKSFKLKGDYNKHMKIHSNVKNFLCHLCDAKFIESYSLKAHLLTHTQERPHRCAFCDARFNLPGNLKQHVLRKHPEANA